MGWGSASVECLSFHFAGFGFGSPSSSFDPSEHVVNLATPLPGKLTDSAVKMSVFEMVQISGLIFTFPWVQRKEKKTDGVGVMNSSILHTRQNHFPKSRNQRWSHGRIQLAKYIYFSNMAGFPVIFFALGLKNYWSNHLVQIEMWKSSGHTKN